MKFNPLSKRQVIGFPAPQAQDGKDCSSNNDQDQAEVDQAECGLTDRHRERHESRQPQVHGFLEGFEHHDRLEKNSFQGSRLRDPTDPAIARSITSQTSMGSRLRKP